MRNRNENVMQLRHRKFRWGERKKGRNGEEKMKMKNSIMNLTTNSGTVAAAALA